MSVGAVTVLCRKVNGVDSGIIDIGFKKTWCRQPRAFVYPGSIPNRRTLACELC